MIDLQQAVNRYMAWGEPHPRAGQDVAFAQRIGLPAARSEIDLAWPDGVDPEAVAFWSVVGSADLFRDVDYGQWGLHLLTPEESFERTRQERINRPDDLRPDDVVIGEFLGDLDLLLLAPSEEDERRVLVALPLDDRADWDAAAPTLVDFLNRFYDAEGEKYWTVPGS